MNQEDATAFWIIQGLERIELRLSCVQVLEILCGELANTIFLIGQIFEFKIFNSTLYTHRHMGAGGDVRSSSY